MKIADQRLGNYDFPFISARECMPAIFWCQSQIALPTVERTRPTSQTNLLTSGNLGYKGSLSVPVRSAKGDSSARCLRIQTIASVTFCFTPWCCPLPTLYFWFSSLFLCRSDGRRYLALFSIP